MNISQYKESLRKKGWYFCMQELSKRVFPLRWVGSKPLMDALYEERAYRRLLREYRSRLDHIAAYRATDAQCPPIIWVCWLQGEENAPPLVRQCIASMRRHAGGCEVRVVTGDNLPALIDIPEYITRKLRQRKMQFATYSDYIRLALLERYGGIWIDSTVLLTAQVPDEVLRSSLFFFQAPPFRPSRIAGSSWFLAAAPGHPVICMTKWLMEQYWQRHNRLINYYLFHLLLTLVVSETAEGRQALRAMPYRSNAEVHLMQRELFELYDEARFAEYARRAFCHKLTYKTRDRALLERPGTTYQYLLNHHEA